MRTSRRFIGICAVFALAVRAAAAPATQPAADGAVSPQPAARIPQTQMGVAQLPNEKLQWMLDDKFGMFIHWGLYSGIARGEWVMEHEGIPPEQYRKYAYPQSGDAYFD